MRLTPLLPSRLRVGVDALRQGLTDVANARLSRGRPVFRSMHSPAELKALSQAAADAQAKRHQDAKSAGRRGEVDAHLRDLSIVEVRRPTTDSVTLVFENPEADPIRFTPGQFMTLLLTIDGEELRRAYSFMSDPADLSRVAITIKRVPGGKASSWLTKNAAPGMRLRTLGPSGRFGTSPRPDEGRRVILVAGGSGITPLYAIAMSLLHREPLSHVELYYGNRSRKDVIFLAELEELAARHEAFTLTHVLEEAPEFHDGPIGRLAGALFDEVVPADPFAEYYICGPDPMMEGAIASLRARGVPEAKVYMERFTAPAQAGPRAPTGAVYSLQFARSGVLIQAPDSSTLLDAGLEAGVGLSYSCTFGGCGACKVKVLEGDVEMEEPNCLTETERRCGEVLACVARARGPVIVDA